MGTHRGANHSGPNCGANHRHHHHGIESDHLAVNIANRLGPNSFADAAAHVARV